MAHEYQVVLARFDDVDTASDALRSLAKSTKLADWAVVVNKGNGDIAFKEGKDAGGGRGFVLGTLATAAAAIALGPVGWAGLAAGGAAGGLVAKLHDANIPSGQLEELGKKLEVGNAAVLVVVEGTNATGISQHFTQAGAQVAAVGVSDELKSALESLAPAGTTVPAA